MQVQPYLFFEGRCEEALEFYRRSLGAEIVALKRYSESPAPQSGEGCAEPMAMPPDKVMHAHVNIGTTTVLASDGMCSGKMNLQGFSLALTVADDAEAARVFEVLGSDGGQVRMPLARTFFTSSFGMVADRFGVPWMVIADSQPA